MVLASTVLHSIPTMLSGFTFRTLFSLNRSGYFGDHLPYHLREVIGAGN